MFRGGIELSYRQAPHVQLLKEDVFDGCPIDHITSETTLKVEYPSPNRMRVVLDALYARTGFYQVKWWVMLPFSEDVSVDGDPVDVYTDAAAKEAGLKYGRHWVRVKLYPARNGMRVRVGRFTFTIEDSDLKNLMVYRRLDNSLVELEWIWWNTDRNGPIPHKRFFANAFIDVKEGG